MADYQLTPDADNDLLEIARYTLKTWGDEQTARYEGKLHRCFEEIARGQVRARLVKKTRPDMFVTRCEHHYVFYRIRAKQAPLILAVLHENMHLMKRLRDRLDG